MSIWATHDLTDKVVHVLSAVSYDHHFGRPFVTAYQLAIELQHRHPDMVDAIGEPLGGAETGQRSSLSQYVARELSRRIKANPEYPVEGAFLWSEHVDMLSFVASDGTRVTSSLTGSGYPLSMFRLRD